MRYFLTGILWLLVSGATAFATENDEGGQAGNIVMDGYQQFIDSCAFCHGIDGKGQGEAANLLSVQPANLTLLSKNNDGVFPLEYLFYSIDGRDDLTAHGSGEMPVWGNLWEKGVPPEFSQAYVRSRIFQIIMYLNSIQE